MENKVVRKLDDVLMDENIIGTAEFREHVQFVLKKISDSIALTIGPGGGFALISNIDAQVPVYPTKDGYTVVQEFKFNDQVKYFIAEIVKDISRRMNVNVGDSTTSGIIIAEKLYKYLSTYDIVNTHPDIGCILPPISMRIILESIRETLLSKLSNNENYVLKNLVREIENEYIQRVATIASNNDSDIGNAVSELFTSRTTNHVFVTAEVGSTDETIINREVGFQFGAGFINPIMANQPDRITCKLIKPKFLLVDGPLTANDISTLHMIIDYVIQDLKQPIVLVAKDFDQVVLNMIVERCTRSTQMKGNVPYLHEREPIAALTINTEYEKSKDRMEDLRLLLGCEIVETKKGKIMNFKNNSDFIDKFLGEAEEFNGTQLSTRIKRGKGDKEAILERIKHIEKRIKEIDSNEGILAFTTIDNLRRRIAMMNSDMTIIRVGGANDKERRAKRLIFDDAILACSSAIDNGFTIGGNVSIPHYISNNMEDLVNEITGNLISKSRNIVVGNREEDVSRIVKDMLEFVKESFKSAYDTAIKNMVGDNTPAYSKIIDSVYINCPKDKPVIFNLVKGTIAAIDEKDAIVAPANTDFELMSSIFGTVGTLISSNQFISIYPGQSTIYRVAK